MKCYVGLLNILFLLVACRSEPELSQYSKIPLISSLYYFAEDNSYQFSCVGLGDSVVAIYEYNPHLVTIQKCTIKNSNTRISSCYRYIGDSLLYSNLGEKYFNLLNFPFNINQLDVNSIFKFYNTRFVRLDSIEFWNRTSLFLDSIVFDLSRDKYLLDFTYSNQKVDQNISIDQWALSKNIGRDATSLPKLFFEVEIDKLGNIVAVDYNSWGKEIYKDLIVGLKPILFNKSLQPYSFLGYPVRVKMTVGVIIK